MISLFDKTDETQAQIQITSLEQLLINNHVEAPIKGKFRRQLQLDQIFEFCKTFEKIFEHLGFNLTFKTTDLQDIIYTTQGDKLEINFDNLFLFVSILNPDPHTQKMLNDSVENSFTFSFDSWTSDRKTVDTQLDYQVDMGPAQKINSPKYLTVAHQTAARIGVPNKANNIAIFDKIDVRKNHVVLWCSLSKRWR